MKFRSLFLTALITVTLVGCGKLRTSRLGKPIGDFSGIGAFEEPSYPSLNSNELTIAQRVCASLKAKRISLETNPGAIAYYFNQEQRDCKNTITETQKFISNILKIETELEYSTKDVTKFYRYVVTDETQSIKLMCESILDISTELNTKKISNTIGILDKLFTISFFVDKKSSYDSIRIFTRVRDAKGSYNLDNAQEIKVATNAAQLGAAFIGVEKERNHYVACNGLEFSTVKETWLSAVAPIP